MRSANFVASSMTRSTENGTDDELILYNSSERLQAYITAPYQLITLVGARHNNISTFALYQEEIDRILK